VALLDGLQRSLSKTMGQLGADVFQIQKWPNFNFGPLSPDILKRKNLTLQHVVQLRDVLPQAKQVGGEVWDFGKEVTAGGQSDPGAAVSGGTAEFFTNNNLPIGSGRGYTEAEAMGGVRGALAQQAESTYHGLPTDEHRTLARALFLRLIEPGASTRDTTRWRAALIELELADSAQTARLRMVAEDRLHSPLSGRPVRLSAHRFDEVPVESTAKAGSLQRLRSTRPASTSCRRGCGAAPRAFARSCAPPPRRWPRWCSAGSPTRFSAE